MKNLRFRLCLSHLCISALVIGLATTFILLIWYPGALAQLEGVYAILAVMVVVDVGAGPLCTLVVASPGKSRRELMRDLATIAGIQLLALGYALYATGTARPAYVVYSFGQFDIEHVNQLSSADIPMASDSQFASPPFFGPQFVEARLPADKALADPIIVSTMAGKVALKDMPEYFLHWPASGSDALKKSRRVTDLWEKGELRPAAVALLRTQNLTEADGLVLPIYAQARRGTVVLRSSDLGIVGIIAGLAP
jgi:hypothetical protein